jgi:hypothetical protein
VEQSADPDQVGPEKDAPISDITAGGIASLFKLRVDEVILDVHQVSTWAGPNDDLLAGLEQLHAWNAREAIAYLLSLRYALRDKSIEGTIS